MGDFFIVLLLVVVVLFFISCIIFLNFLFIASLIDALLFAIFKKSFCIHSFNFGKRLSYEQEEQLLQLSPYYRSLPVNKRKVFSYRVRKFMRTKNFEGRQGLEVTPVMMLFVAAAAIKVTFGYRNYLLNNFHTIIIYPEMYFSRVTQTHNKGETNTSGIIVFSWKDFLLGFQDMKDSVNLGYHELAHALYIDERTHNRNKAFAYYHNKWEQVLRDGETVRKIKDNKIFRDYATANHMEFFAVTLENFFETPKSFRDELPSLYELMTKMLNQNPLV